MHVTTTCQTRYFCRTKPKGALLTVLQIKTSQRHCFNSFAVNQEHLCIFNTFILAQKSRTQNILYIICDLEYEKGASPHFNRFEICNKIAKKLKARRISFFLLNILRDMLPFIYNLHCRYTVFRIGETIVKRVTDDRSKANVSIFI